jgi:hypothetical protein
MRNVRLYRIVPIMRGGARYPTIRVKATSKMAAEREAMAHLRVTRGDRVGDDVGHLNVYSEGVVDRRNDLPAGWARVQL